MDQRAGMLRGGHEDADRVLREGDRNMSGGRVQHGGSAGSALMFYEDLGFSSTAEGRDTILANQKAFDEALAADSERLAGFQKGYDKDLKTLNKSKKDLSDYSFENPYSYDAPNISKAANKSYDKHKKELIKLRTMGRGGKVENIAYVPREFAKDFEGKRGIFFSWHPGNYANIMVKDFRNGDINGSISQAQSQYKNAYLKKASKSISSVVASNILQTKKLNKAARGVYDDNVSNWLTNIRQSETVLGQSGDALSKFRSDLNLSVEQNEGEWAQARENYSKRMENIREALGGI